MKTVKCQVSAKIVLDKNIDLVPTLENKIADRTQLDLKGKTLGYYLLRVTYDKLMILQHMAAAI